MDKLSHRARRGFGAVLVAAVLGVTVSAVGHAAAGSGGSPNGPAPAARSASVLAAAPAMAAGSELRFISLPPCRILDTRFGGGVLVAAARTFTATGVLTAQGGSAAGCGVPATAANVELSLGALSVGGGNGFVTAWKTGTTRPLASAVNYNTSGPASTLATVELSSAGQFDLYTNSQAHLFADVIGYWTKPLYAALTPAGLVYQGMASGVVGVTRLAAGTYEIQFERNVRMCSAQGTDLIFVGTRDVSVDNTFPTDNATVRVVVTNAAGVNEDTFLAVSLTC